MLHISKTACMKHHHYTNHLATAHSGFSLGFISDQMFLNRLLKFNAKFINKIVNFSNFIVR